MEPVNGTDISWKTLWRIATMVAIFAVVYAGLQVILGLAIAIVIAAALDAPVTWLQKKRIPRIVGAFAIFFLVFVAVAALVYVIVPVALAEFTSFFTQFKGASGNVFGFIKASQIITLITERFNDLSNALISGNISLLTIGSFLLGGIFLTIAVTVLAFYLTVGQDGVERFILAVVPPIYEDYALDLYFRVRHKIGKWLKGQLILSVIVAITVFIGLWLLDVNYALLLALLAGVFEIIPFIGPIVSGGLAVLLALSNSFTVAMYTLALFIIVQQAESHVLVPTVMRFTVELNPALVVIALMIGGAVFGFVGVVLAVPVAVLLQEIGEDWNTRKHKQKGLEL